VIVQLQGILITMGLIIVSGLSAAQENPRCDASEAIKLSDGTVVCVAGLRPPTPEEQAKRNTQAAEELAERRQLAAVLLTKDVIKIEATYRMDEGVGNPVARNTWWTAVWEARPTSGSFRYYITQAGSVCYRGEPKAKFSITADGMVRVSVLPHLKECDGVVLEFDPISRLGTMSLIDGASGSERRSLAGTRLRLLEN
jgi:hypothetical protein